MPKLVFSGHRTKFGFIPSFGILAPVGVNTGPGMPIAADLYLFGDEFSGIRVKTGDKPGFPRKGRLFPEIGRCQEKWNVSHGFFSSLLILS